MIGRKEKKQEGERVLDVDASMQGSLIFKDPVNLRINGRFEGTLNTKGSLMIGENAVVSADITGEIIVIAGRVNGNITAAKELKLIAPACVVGDIRTVLLSIAEGAVFEGSSSMLTKPRVEGGIRHDSMTPDELAKYLEVDPSMIVEWVNSGKLPANRDGSTWTFDREKVDEWVASGKIR